MERDGELDLKALLRQPLDPRNQPHLRVRAGVSVRAGVGVGVGVRVRVRVRVGVRMRVCERESVIVRVTMQVSVSVSVSESESESESGIENGNAGQRANESGSRLTDRGDGDVPCADTNLRVDSPHRPHHCAHHHRIITHPPPSLQTPTTAATTARTALRHNSRVSNQPAWPVIGSKRQPPC